MSNKLVYITGLITSEDEEKTKTNIDYLLQTADKIKSLGDKVQLPRSIISYLCGLTKEDPLAKEEEEVIKRCDCIVLIEGWNYSEEALEAIKIASKNDLRILFDKDLSYPDYVTLSGHIRKSLKMSSYPSKEEFQKDKDSSKFSSDFAKDILTYSPTLEKSNLWNMKKSLIPVWLDLDSHEVKVQYSEQTHQNVSYDSLVVEVYLKDIENPVSTYKWDGYQNSLLQKQLNSKVEESKKESEYSQETAKNALLELEGLLKKNYHNGVISYLDNDIDFDYSSQSGLSKTIVELLKLMSEEKAIDFIKTHSMSTSQSYRVLDHLLLEI